MGGRIRSFLSHLELSLPNFPSMKSNYNPRGTHCVLGQLANHPVSNTQPTSAQHGLQRETKKKKKAVIGADSNSWWHQSTQSTSSWWNLKRWTWDFATFKTRCSVSGYTRALIMRDITPMCRCSIELIVWGDTYGEGTNDFEWISFMQAETAV